MVAGFNLELENNFCQKYQKHSVCGLEQYEKRENEVIFSLKKFKDSNGKIDGTKLRTHWFPIKKYDLFISHSSLDKNLAIVLAGIFYNKFGITSFIDSCLWDNVYNLNHDVDKELAYGGKDQYGDFFSYEKCNITSKHIFMLLSTALSEMIDKCSYIIFLNTPQSISINKENVYQTESPWIYLEILMSKLIRVKRLTEDRIYNSLESAPIFTYDIDISHLKSINNDDIDNLLASNIKEEIFNKLDNFFNHA